MNKRSTKAESKIIDGGDWENDRNTLALLTGTQNPHFELITATLEDPPTEAYLVQTDAIESLERFCHEQDNEAKWWHQYSPAIRIQVIGKTIGNDYAADSKVVISTGIINLPVLRLITIARESIHLVRFWLTDLWACAGFEPRSSDALPFCKDKEPLTEFFSVLNNNPAQLTSKHRALLMTSFLFPYWQTRDEELRARTPSSQLSDTDRARHLIQLGVCKSLSRGNLRNACYEAGCLPMPESVFKKEWTKFKNTGARLEKIQAKLRKPRAIDIEVLRKTIAGRLILRELELS
ncbi:MAG: hypothetical protein QOD99_1184 [Chthoniobacter sp.]|nr:hypothetical protein [Chthoniobacter sp.]